MAQRYRVVLNKLDVEKSRLFLDYLMAELRGLKSGFPFVNGNAGFIEDQIYETNLSGLLEILSPTPVDLKLHQSSEGKIQFVEFKKHDDNEFDENEKRKLSEFCNIVLQKALANSLEEFEFRDVYSYFGPDLSGEYWIRGFRFSPAIKESNDKRYILNAQRFVVIDQKVKGIDAHHARVIATRKANEVSALLSLILNVAIVQEPHFSVYTYNPEPPFEPMRRNMGHLQLPMFKKIPEKGIEMQLGDFSGSVFDSFRYAGELVCMPKEVRRVFKYVFEHSFLSGKSYLNCSKLYRLGIIYGRYSRTSSLSYKVAAIESLAQGSEHSLAFSEFMKKYGGGISDEMLEFLYKRIRSAHIHAGEFLLEDYNYENGDALVSPSAHSLSMAEFSANKVIRAAIFNSILSNLPSEDD